MGTAGSTWYRNTEGTVANWPKAFSTVLDKGRGVTAYAVGRARPRILVSGKANGGEVREFFGNDWAWTSTGQSAKLTGLGDTYMSVVADLDDDGVLDVVGTSTQNGDVLWSRNMTGTRTTIEDNCQGARGVCTADLDGDGDLDVAAACQNENNLYWWQNNNNGASWTKQTIQSYWPTATDVKCGDINNDGKVEIVATSRSQGWIGWFGYQAPGYTQGWVTQAFTGTATWT
jgi:hypothetical protein